MKENLKNTTGITLVALVITIIILLILATVTIRIVLSEGIIRRAENAVNSYNTAQNNELAQLNNAEEKMNLFGPKEFDSNWWKIKEEEKDKLPFYYSYHPTYVDFQMAVVALSEDEKISVRLEKTPDAENITMIKVYTENLELMYITEEMATLATNLTANKWYDKTTGKQDIEKCPFSLSDFPDQELQAEQTTEGRYYSINIKQYGIASKSYLQRVIDSFNN